MSVSTSKAAYEDCYALLDRALESHVGIRHKQPNEGQAMIMRMRLNYARTLARDANAEIFPPDHPQHGISVYDPLLIRVVFDERDWWIYIEQRTISEEHIEELQRDA